MRTTITADAVADALKTGKVWAVSDGRTKEFMVKGFAEGPFVVVGENGIGLPNTLSLKRMSEDLGFTFEKEESPNLPGQVHFRTDRESVEIYQNGKSLAHFCEEGNKEKNLTDALLWYSSNCILRPLLPPKQGDSLL